MCLGRLEDSPKRAVCSFVGRFHMSYRSKSSDDSATEKESVLINLPKMPSHLVNKLLRDRRYG